MDDIKKADDFETIRRNLLLARSGRKNEWLQNNYHPHAKIIIEADHAEIVEGVYWSSL